MKLLCTLAIGFAALAPGPLLEARDAPPEAPSPPTRVQALDVPNDSGHAIEIRWKDSPDPGVHSYEVFRSRPPGETAAGAAQDPWVSLGTAGPGEETWTFSSAERGVRYSFKVVAATADSSADSEIVTGESRAQWFDWNKLWILIIGGTICFFVILFIQLATRGRKLFVRKIAGLEAVDEAVGRATEMGRPVVFVPGIMDMDNVQ
ncbi:MAG: fibronectin type III domain-containing protein, partial [Gammaproteobacteria bacterium]|nr:fibronectin type III domain-containing protein [Gammaproteobacteria bacterium]